MPHASAACEGMQGQRGVKSMKFRGASAQSERRRCRRAGAWGCDRGEERRGVCGPKGARRGVGSELSRRCMLISGGAGRAAKGLHARRGERMSMKAVHARRDV